MAPQANEEHVRILPLKYDSNDSDSSARQLLFTLRPDWSSADSVVELVRFTDGITNTLLKAVNRRPGLSRDEIDHDAILLRAYGHGTDLIIDRLREAQNHELLMRHGLAPVLLARFENGMMYRFVRGVVTRPDDLRRPEISAAIARRLAQWHATVPCIPQAEHTSNGASPRLGGNGPSELRNDHSNEHPRDIADEKGYTHEHNVAVAQGKLEPNLWSVMQKWILALPADTPAQQKRTAVLQNELQSLISELSQRPGLGKNGLVFSHNDLLSGNVIVLPKEAGQKGRLETEVTFIDYEYAVPSPAAFDIANHFAEWGGFDCDISVLPTVSQRRAFISEYIRTYTALQSPPTSETAAFDPAVEEDKLLQEVDVFRGVPGFYWGIWALIQATISEIDFDYASYAEIRLSEYWAWKAEAKGERVASGAEMPPREKRWAQEADTDNNN